jgi:hypothetical protein
MGAVPKKREEISPGESSRWGVGKVAEKEIGRITGIKGCFGIRAKKQGMYLKGASHGNPVQEIHPWHP